MRVSIGDNLSIFFVLRFIQYLNCKILHGGTLLQTWPNAFGMRKYFSKDYVIPSPKLNEDPKNRNKGLRRELKCFFPEIRWRPKKRSSPIVEVYFPRNQFTPAIWDDIRPEFVRLIHAGWLFFVWLSSAQISMGVTPKSRWGDAKSRWRTRPPYNLSTGFIGLEWLFFIFLYIISLQKQRSCPVLAFNRVYHFYCIATFLSNCMEDQAWCTSMQWTGNLHSSLRSLFFV